MPEKVQKWRDLRQQKPRRNIGRNIENIPFRDVFFCEFEQFYFNTSKHSSELLDTTEHAFAAFLGKCKENFSRIL